MKGKKNNCENFYFWREKKTILSMVLFRIEEERKKTFVSLNKYKSIDAFWMKKKNQFDDA